MENKEIFENALKELEELKEVLYSQKLKYVNIVKFNLEDIKDALIKAQEQDKILKALKPYIELSSDGIISCHNLILIPYYKDYEEQYNLLKEWLDNGKD